MLRKRWGGWMHLELSIGNSSRKISFDFLKDKCRATIVNREKRKHLNIIYLGDNFLLI